MKYDFKFEEYPVLSDYETMLLLELYHKNGNIIYRDEIILSNMRLILHMINKFPDHCFYHIQREDLISAGIQALMNVIETFNHDYNAKFSTFAGKAIMQKVITEITKNYSVVKLPEQLYNIKRKINKLREEGLSNILISEKLNIEYHTLLLYDRLSTVGNSSSIHEKIAEDFTIEDTLHDTDSQYDMIDNSIDSEILSKDIFDNMSPRDKYIIEHRYGLSGSIVMTLEEISHVYKCSKENIRQIEIRILRKLKNKLDKTHANKNCLGSSLNSNCSYFNVKL